MMNCHFKTRILTTWSDKKLFSSCTIQVVVNSAMEIDYSEREPKGQRHVKCEEVIQKYKNKKSKHTQSTKIPPANSTCNTWKMKLVQRTKNELAFKFTFRFHKATPSRKKNTVIYQPLVQQILEYLIDSYNVHQRTKSLRYTLLINSSASKTHETTFNQCTCIVHQHELIICINLFQKSGKNLLQDREKLIPFIFSRTRKKIPAIWL